MIYVILKTKRPYDHRTEQLLMQLKKGNRTSLSVLPVLQIRLVIFEKKAKTAQLSKHYNSENDVTDPMVSWNLKLTFNLLIV